VALHLEAVGEVVLPERRVPAREPVAAPDVVDEHVEAAVLVVADPLGVVWNSLDRIEVVEKLLG
jgi:hypothetical protein